MTEQASPFLTPGEERLLLRIARDSLAAYVNEERRIDVDAYPLTPVLREPHGAFVTLHLHGELRGCIGHTRNLEPLARAVRDNAINAAVRDPRFPPVSPGEVGQIHIEVSALRPGAAPDTPFIPVRDIGEIVIGRDGVYLEGAGARGGGLLLPQVPVERNWDVRQFMEAVCAKAGAAPDAWNDPACRIYRFSAQVFAEPAPAGNGNGGR
ncbi:MAG: AmmeMemoRadiSam system protein A [Candidatus Hydrogenedentes bacterium]|nr:AmmeMemoRadiSam system protein A [Candidatus Hydrogenedentota bacterium]